MSHTAGPWHVAPGDSRRVVLPGLAKTIDAGNNGNARLIAATPELLAAAQAAIAYDDAIQSCANDPNKMSSFCSAEGDDLDALYLAWITTARNAVAKADAR